MKFFIKRQERKVKKHKNVFKTVHLKTIKGNSIGVCMSFFEMVNSFSLHYDHYLGFNFIKFPSPNIHKNTVNHLFHHRRVHRLCSEGQSELCVCVGGKQDMGSGVHQPFFLSL